MGFNEDASPLPSLKGPLKAEVRLYIFIPA